MTRMITIKEAHKYVPTRRSCKSALRTATGKRSSRRAKRKTGCNCHSIFQSVWGNETRNLRRLSSIGRSLSLANRSHGRKYRYFSEKGPMISGDVISIRGTVSNLQYQPKMKAKENGQPRYWFYVFFTTLPWLENAMSNHGTHMIATRLVVRISSAHDIRIFGKESLHKGGKSQSRCSFECCIFQLRLECFHGIVHRQYR
jgi:hypothetical protein